MKRIRSFPFSYIQVNGNIGSDEEERLPVDNGNAQERDTSHVSEVSLLFSSISIQ